jgi:hypothetical protein
MDDKEIGSIKLGPTAKIVFGIGMWKGSRRGSFRTYLLSDRYSGPTKSGLSLDGTVLSHLLAVLKRLACTVPTGSETVFDNVGKTRGSDIRITILTPDEKSTLPRLDIREFVETATYIGPTKKGVRFAWDKLHRFIELLEVLVHELGAVVEADPTLFPDNKPTWIKKASDVKQTVPQIIEGFDVTTLKPFPDAFLPASTFDAEVLILPTERLRIELNREGHYYVTNGSGFHRQVRNEVEGKFFIYAQQRKKTELCLPKEMFKIFSAVTTYEKYCRELRQSLVQMLEVRSGNRSLAEYLSRQTFEAQGLPYC